MRRDRRHAPSVQPLQGDWAQEWKRRHAPGDVWPDEVILVAGEQHWIGADAIGKCLHLLPFPYPMLGWIYAHLPGRKKIYRWLAQHRYTWFGKKRNSLQRAQHRVHGANRVRTLVESGLLLVVEFVVYNLLPAVFTNHHGYAQADVALAVFAVEVDATGENFLLVADNARYQSGTGCTGSIPRRCANQAR